MRNEFNRSGRQARSVCIVTSLPVWLQGAMLAVPKFGEKPVTMDLGWARVRVTALRTENQVMIELEPP